MSTHEPEYPIERRLQTRDGRLMRRIMARARTEVRREAERLMLQIASSVISSPVASPKVEDDTETDTETKSKCKLSPDKKRIRKRIQNRRSIEKCRRRDLFRRARLTAEAASLEYDNMLLKDALKSVRTCGALDFVEEFPV